MKKIATLMALLVISVQSAEAANKWHYFRKALWLPVYVCFAQPISILCWYKVADNTEIHLSVKRKQPKVSTIVRPQDVRCACLQSEGSCGCKTDPEIEDNVQANSLDKVQLR